MRGVAIAALLMLGCNTDPGELDEQVGYRDTLETGPDNGERGNVVISEVLWSGSVRETDDGFEWDPEDVFIELRNEGNRPVNVSQWYLELSGSAAVTFRIPDTDARIEVGDHVFVAASDSGCFPEPDWVIPELFIPTGDPFRITLRDVDERLMEPIGDEEMPPFAGGYDLVISRSMERIELMFGGRGTEPQMWHHYTPADVDVPNNDNVAPACRARTHASPGRPNSPDYSGAYAQGGFE